MKGTAAERVAIPDGMPGAKTGALWGAPVPNVALASTLVPE